MKSTYARRYRSNPSTSRESGMQKKDSQQEQPFFGGSSHESFFKPNASIQRKCDHCEGEENIQRTAGHQEEEKKIHRMDMKEEDKELHRLPGPEEEEKKIHKMDMKEEDKELHRLPGSEEEEKKIHKMDMKEEDKELHRLPVPGEEEKKIHKMDMKEEDKELHRLPAPGEEEKKIHKMDMKEEDKKLHRLPAPGEEEKKIHKKDAAGDATSTVGNYVNSINGKGQPLPNDVRAFYESKMGSDFTDVKIHTGKEAEQSAKDVNAQAYTYGKNIVFNDGKYEPETNDGKRLLAHELTHVIQQTGKIQPRRDSNYMIQRVPAPGRNFGTRGYCGFGINTGIPGFVQNYMTDNFNVDYKSGCNEVWLNAWGSLWELYDASEKKIGTKSRTPLGDYDIAPAKINSGVPGDDTALWSLWYRVTENQPWSTGDNDAYPYDYAVFPVYAYPYRNTNVQVKEESGPVVWQEKFTPAEDGASLEYNFQSSESRSSSDSQTSNVSVSARGDKSVNFGFDFEGLSGGFSKSLSMEVAASISRTRSLSIESHRSESQTINQPNLLGGVEYNISARPLYYVLDGSVGLINHRDGVVINGGDKVVSGAIRILKGMEYRIDKPVSATAKGRWSCEASCNVEGKGEGCTGRVTGSSSGHPNEKDACREAKRSATQKAPRGCYARHCRCYNCKDR